MCMCVMTLVNSSLEILVVTDVNIQFFFCFEQWTVWNLVKISVKYNCENTVLSALAMTGNALGN